MHAGFRLFRATKNCDGDYTNITLLDHPQGETLTATPLATVTGWNHLITATGPNYSYLDVNATIAGTTYFYLVEDVDMGGHSNRHWEQIASTTVGQNRDEEANLRCEDD